MGKNKTHKYEKPLQRRRAFVEPRPRILIICEGTVTEPEYFESFSTFEQNHLVEIEIDREGGSPKTLVERAAKRKKENEKEAEEKKDSTIKYDEIWCVYDVDQHPKLADAWQQARDNGVILAISNPCFELWLVLHFCDQTAHIERKPVQKMLEKYIKGYGKHVPFESIRDRYTEALKRANLLEGRHLAADSIGGNPSTNVHKLTERIREFGRTERLKRH